MKHVYRTIITTLIIMALALLGNTKTSDKQLNSLVATVYQFFNYSEGVLATSTYPVLEVVDGDTLKIDRNGTKETLRLIGINTPETVDPRKPVECFGKEASDKAKGLLAGKVVRIESDPTQSERDRYGRLLVYVYLADGTFFNKKMIEEGYAYEYTYDTPYKYQAEFKEAQRQAELNKRGLWGSACKQKTP